MTTYYVRTTGSDVAAGTDPSTAWLTVDKAANTVAAGDTVYIGGGTYREAVTNDTNGTSGNVISYIGDITGQYTGDAGPVIISAYDIPRCVLPSRAYALDVNNAQFVTWKYVIFHGHSGNTYAPVMEMASATPSYEQLTFDHCAFVMASGNDEISVRLRYNAGTTPTGSAGLLIDGCVFWGGRLYINVTNNVTAHVNAKAIIRNNVWPIDPGNACVYFVTASAANANSVGGFTIQNNLFNGQGIYYNYPKNSTNTIDLVGNIVVRDNIVQGDNITAGAIRVGDNAWLLDDAPTLVANVTDLGGNYISTALFGGIHDLMWYHAIGWSPWKPYELFGEMGTGALVSSTYAPATDLYGNPRPMAGTKLIYSFMNGSDAAVTDPNAKWTNETLITNTTVTDVGTCTTQGDAATNYVKAEGTSHSGDAVPSQVRARVYGRVQNANNSLVVTIYTNAGAETLGTFTLTNTTLAYTAWTTLSAPAAGWTAADVAALEFKAWKSDANAGTVYLYQVQIEATVIQDDAGPVEARARGQQETSVVYTGSSSMKFPGAGYHDVLLPVDAVYTTVSVNCQRDANYTGDNPILRVYNIPGVADQSQAQTVGADTDEQLQVSFTPTAAGFCRVRLESRDTSTTGICYFDDLLGG